MAAYTIMPAHDSDGSACLCHPRLLVYAIQGFLRHDCCGSACLKAACAIRQPQERHFWNTPAWVALDGIGLRCQESMAWALYYGLGSLEWFRQAINSSLGHSGI
eukprot:292480-Pelagomonas_calceolata.AAC.10